MGLENIRNFRSISQTIPELEHVQTCIFWTWKWPQILDIIGHYNWASSSFFLSYKAENLYPSPLNGAESKYSVENAEKNLPVCENVQWNCTVSK